MNTILNTIGGIKGYMGPGMVLAIIGIVIIIAAIRTLLRISTLKKENTAISFDQQFIQNTGTGLSDIDAGAMRKKIAEEFLKKIHKI